MEEAGIRTRTELFNNAMTLLRWVIKQRKEGRAVASVDHKDKSITELEMPIFAFVEDKRQELSAASEQHSPQQANVRPIEKNHDDCRLRRSESIYPDPDVLNDLLIRQAEQNIRHRDLLVGALLVLYSLTLAATLSLFFFSGLGILSFSDNVLISLWGVVTGEVQVGAILMQIVKSIFFYP